MYEGGGLDDPTAAYDFITVVEDGRLAGGDGALRSIKRRKNFVLARHFNSGPGGLVAVADFDLYAHALGESGNADPIATARSQCPRGQFGVGAHCDTMAVGVDAEDV